MVEDPGRHDDEVGTLRHAVGLDLPFLTVPARRGHLRVEPQVGPQAEAVDDIAVIGEDLDLTIRHQLIAKWRRAPRGGHAARSPARLGIVGSVGQGLERRRAVKYGPAINENGQPGEGKLRFRFADGETFTLTRLGIDRRLRETLQSTNPLRVDDLRRAHHAAERQARGDAR